jgi:hypothetical protein
MRCRRIGPYRTRTAAVVALMPVHLTLPPHARVFAAASRWHIAPVLNAARVWKTMQQVTKQAASMSDIDSDERLLMKRKKESCERRRW